MTFRVGDQVRVTISGTPLNATIIAVGGKLFVRYDGSCGQEWVDEKFVFARKMVQS